MVLATGTVLAQTDKADKDVHAALAQYATRHALVESSLKPNEIASHGHAYSGAVVQVIKVDHPLQLINPFAPAEYGSGEDNVSRDWDTHRATGIKFFSMKF